MAEKKKKKAAAEGDGEPKEHKKNWREVYATVEDIKGFLGGRLYLRHNVITGRVECRLPSNYETDGTDWQPISDRVVNSLWAELSLVVKLVPLAALRADGYLLSVYLPENEPAPHLAHPAYLACGIAHHQSVWHNIFGDHRTGTYKGIFTYIVAANYSGVGPYGSPLPHHCPAVTVLAAYCAARIDDIGEHAAWPQEYIISANHTGIDRYIVLHLTVASKSNAWRNHDILADVAPLTKHSTLHNVGEMPDLASGSDRTTLVNHRCRVSKILFFHIGNF